MLLCRKLDLFGRELLGVDGTRLKAVNSRDRTFTQAKLGQHIKSADERLLRYLAELDDADCSEDGVGKEHAEALAVKIAKVRGRRQVNQAMLDQLQASGENQISVTDPDARAMAARPKVGVGYNAQVAVDAKHKLIVEQHVSNAGSNLSLLAQTAGAAKAVLGVERIDAVADMAYYKGENIEACEQDGITPYGARPQRGRAVDNGHFTKNRFCYDVEADLHTLPRRSDTRHPLPLGHPQPCVEPVLKSCRLRCLCDQGPLYRRSLAPHQPLGERGDTRPHGGAPRCSPPISSPPISSAPISSPCGARLSSIRSARSSNGLIRAPS